MSLIQKPGDPTRVIRLDPIAIFLLFYALAAMIGVIVFTSGASDVVTYANKYLVITAATAGFAPLLVGTYFYDPRQVGPILRPITFGHFPRKETFPDVAIIGLLTGYISVLGVNYVFTYGGFTPTLSFWNTLTNKVFYSSGGIFEEFIFRAVFYGAVNRFVPGLLKNKAAFFLFAAPLNSVAFTLYHVVVYFNSTLALNIVFAEAYVLNSTYRALRYPLWVVMILHAAINWTSTP